MLQARIAVVMFHLCVLFRCLHCLQEPQVPRSSAARPTFVRSAVICPMSLQVDTDTMDMLKAMNLDKLAGVQLQAVSKRPGCN